MYNNQIYGEEGSMTMSPLRIIGLILAAIVLLAILQQLLIGPA